MGSVETGILHSRARLGPGTLTWAELLLLGVCMGGSQRASYHPIQNPPPWDRQGGRSNGSALKGASSSLQPGVPSSFPATGTWALHPSPSPATAFLSRGSSMALHPLPHRVAPWHCVPQVVLLQGWLCWVSDSHHWLASSPGRNELKLTRQISPEDCAGCFLVPGPCRLGLAQKTAPSGLHVQIPPSLFLCPISYPRVKVLLYLHNVIPICIKDLHGMHLICLYLHMNVPGGMRGGGGSSSGKG